MLCYYYVATCSKLVHTEDFLLFTYHHVQTEALKMESLNSRHHRFQGAGIIIYIGSTKMMWEVKEIYTCSEITT